MHGYHDLHPSLMRAATTAPAASLAALFDVDNTLIPGQACEVRFFRYLWRRGLVGWHEVRRSLSWLIRQSPSVTIHPLRERKLYLEGKDPSVIEVMLNPDGRRRLGERDWKRKRRHWELPSRLSLQAFVKMSAHSMPIWILWH